MEPVTLQPSVQIWAEQAPELVLPDTEFVVFVRPQLRPVATRVFNMRLLHAQRNYIGWINQRIYFKNANAFSKRTFESVCRNSALILTINLIGRLKCLCSLRLKLKKGYFCIIS